MEGTVKWFNGRKRYGFIKGDDGQDYFVHLKAVAKEAFLKEGDCVTFTPTDSEKGKQAQDVNPTGKTAAVAPAGPAPAHAALAHHAALHHTSSHSHSGSRVYWHFSFIPVFIPALHLGNFIRLAFNNRVSKIEYISIFGAYLSELCHFNSPGAGYNLYRGK